MNFVGYLLQMHSMYTVWLKALERCLKSGAYLGQHLFEDNIYNLKVGPNMIIIVLQYGTVLLFSVLN